METMRSLSEGCCIYRVPQETRCLNESDFTPQVISIGPLHHGKEELKEMEEHKRRYLKHFLQRTKVGIEEFLTFIKDKEAKLRSYNSENIELTSDAFVTMILVDSIFMIECLLRYSNPDLVTNDDRIFGKSLYIHLQGPAFARKSASFFFFIFFGLIHKVSWGGPQLWEALLSLYHNPD